MDTARAWADRILANGPLAVRKTKESVLRGLDATLAEARTIEDKIGQEVFRSDDAKEGPKAFAEKRAPQWQNR